MPGTQPSAKPPAPPRLSPDRAVFGARDALDDDDGWSQLDVVDLDLTGAELGRVNLAQCRLERVRLTGSGLAELRLNDCVLDDCDLAGCALDATSWLRVSVTRCRFDGWTAPDAALRDVTFANSAMAGVRLRFAKTDRVSFTGCAMAGADFGSAALLRARFGDCDLTGADFSQAQLTGADLRGSRLDDVVGAKAFAGAVVSPGQVIALAPRLFNDLGITVLDEGDDEASTERR